MSGNHNNNDELKKCLKDSEFVYALGGDKDDDKDNNGDSDCIENNAIMVFPHLSNDVTSATQKNQHQAFYNKKNYNPKEAKLLEYLLSVGISSRLYKEKGVFGSLMTSKNYAKIKEEYKKQKNKKNASSMIMPETIKRVALTELKKRANK